MHLNYIEADAFHPRPRENLPGVPLSAALVRELLMKSIALIDARNSSKVFAKQEVFFSLLWFTSGFPSHTTKTIVYGSGDTV